MDGRGHGKPGVGDTEVWEFYNTTADAHPMHVHEVTFEVVNRQGLVLDEDERGRTTGAARTARPATGAVGDGPKDTVIALPGRGDAGEGDFTHAGQYVWHCHIVEHEDNEMMRPYRIGPEQPGQPVP